MQHLAEISASDPVRLVAHAYTQQMALLAGGQRIRKFVTSTVPGLQGKDGVSVFCFKARLPPWTRLNVLMISAAGGVLCHGGRCRCLLGRLSLKVAWSMHS